MASEPIEEHSAEWLEAHAELRNEKPAAWWQFNRRRRLERRRQALEEERTLILATMRNLP